MTYETRIINKHFDDLNDKLPIYGGWGYTKDKAIIIDKTDEDVDDYMPFRLVSWEHKIVELRLYEELIIFKDKNDRYSSIESNLVKQNMFFEDEKRYDYLVFEVSCFADKDWKLLKNEYNHNIGN